MLCAIARNLDDETLGEIRDLERDVGLTIVAFACRTVDPAREERLRKIEAELGPVLLAPPARPGREQLERIKTVEERLGLSLVAVED